ncbi:MAG: Rieske 2Fe-2S domain-containing protein [Acidimicrobiia bacterium]|nr:Rieske 2Fe-2S domain-containing protein [bacterium]MXW57712.1 Rieske 2Fe-2S domain-containing protein [Acidimicrobiia bacterium]MDE0580790.1 Rieske 2Fe-2S domain-containing protein [bacterium]MDE0613828.1 Rieske 2Fe-2S domain-containing protein [bacterium]MXZ78613.1 Rieske 2Fe-2S domain-containing protein [Acidimicrobiia bacterium]
MGVALSIAIPIIVVAAVIVLIGAARRRETMAAEGRLTRETRRRDRGRVDIDDPAGSADAPTGREVERAAVLARQTAGTELVEAADASVEEWTPPDPDAVGVSRRQFLNRSTVAMMGFSLTGFGAACVAFLWPPFVTGFGADVNAGLVDDVKARIRDENGFLYLPEGRAWVTEYPAAALPKAQATYSAPELTGMEAGLIALFQKCPHLGCRVPNCLTSQWFECPCHGSRYNQVGEKRGGPAPRGMDRFAMSVNAKGEFIISTGTVIQGPAIGVNTTGQEPEGPSCLGGASH